MIALAVTILYQDRKTQECILQERSHLATHFPGFIALTGGKFEQQKKLAKLLFDNEDLDLHLEKQLIENPHFFMDQLKDTLDHSKHAEELTELFLEEAEREAEEELGLVLNQNEEKKNLNRGRFLGYALTPPFWKRKFITLFFHGFIDRQEDIKSIWTRDEFPTDETHDYQWKRPSEWNKKWLAGEILMVPPVQLIIQTLEKLTEKLSDKLDKDQESFFCVSPMLIEQNLSQSVRRLEHSSVVGLSFQYSVWIYPLESQTLPPAMHSNCLIIEHAVEESSLTILDYSPKESATQFHEAFVDHLMTNYPGLKTIQCVLTHHHPDHHDQLLSLLVSFQERAKQVKKRLWTSRETEKRLEKKWGRDYVEQLIAASDEFICRPLSEFDYCSLGKSAIDGGVIQLVSLPGHDDGMLGVSILDEDKTCFMLSIVDLMSWQGSVIIPPAEGDLGVYIESLRKVIDLSPKTIYQAHGTPVGGIEFLKRLIDHRKKRQNLLLEYLAQTFPQESSHYQVLSAKIVAKHFDENNEVYLSASLADQEEFDLMARTLYPGLPEKMLPLAKANVLTHLMSLAKNYDF